MSRPDRVALRILESRARRIIFRPRWKPAHRLGLWVLRVTLDSSLPPRTKVGSFNQHPKVSGKPMKLRLEASWQVTLPAFLLSTRLQTAGYPAF